MLFQRLILNSNYDCQHNIIIQGVPCPNIDPENYAEKDVAQLTELILLFNGELQAKSECKGFGFLDVYKLTDRGDGLSNKVWHIDTNHLSPEGFLEAWQRHTADKSYA